MINLIKQDISELIYKINSNIKDCNCIDYQICNMFYSILDNIKQFDEYNDNVEIKNIISNIKKQCYKYIRYFESDNSKHYNYNEIIKVLEEIDNKLNCVI